MKKDLSIQIVRIISMFFIVVCHIFNEMSNKYIIMTAQFFNIGVYIFLLISGYLYSNKKINKNTFFRNRIKRVILPMYAFMCIIFIYQIIKKEFQIKYLIIYGFNLQGILGGVQGAEHLWFLTAIGICYLLLPILEKYKEKIQNKSLMNLTVIFILASISCYANVKIGRIFICIFTFIVGYIYVGEIYQKNNSIIKNLIIFIIAIIVRLISKFLLDNTILYDYILVGITQIICSICIVIMIHELVKRINLTSCNGNHNLINILDKYSYYIYLTHYSFIIGPFKIINLTSKLLINITMVLECTVILSLILSFLVTSITEGLQKIQRRDKRDD